MILLRIAGDAFDFDASPAPTHPIWLRAYDPDLFDGRGLISTTDDKSLALRFENLGHPAESRDGLSGCQFVAPAKSRDGHLEPSPASDESLAAMTPRTLPTT